MNWKLIFNPWGEARRLESLRQQQMGIINYFQEETRRLSIQVEWLKESLSKPHHHESIKRTTNHPA